MTVDLSILMPLGDTRPYVGDAIRSTLDAGDLSVEVIVIDDGSTDGSLDVIREVDDPRVRVVDADPPGGIATAFNTGLAAARGPLVARCDSDDLMAPGRLARQAAWLDAHPEFGAICGGFASMTAGGRLVADLGCGDDGEEITEELHHGTVRTSLCTFMIRTETLRRTGGCRAYFVTAEDVDLQLRLAEEGRIWFDPARTYLYRLHDDSITHTRPTKLREFYHDTALRFSGQRAERGADDLQNGTPPAPPEGGAVPSTAVAGQIQGNLLGAAWRHHAAGRRWQALATGMRACASRPTSWRAWRSLGALAVCSPKEKRCA